MEGALRRAPPMAPQRHLVVRDALDALAGPAIRPRVPRQQGQVCRAFGALCRGQMQRASDGDSRGAPPPNHLFHPSRRTRRLLIIGSTPAPSARRRPSCAPRLGWQPQQLAPLGCKVHGGAALVTTAPTLREHRRARMHDVQHTPALRPLCAVSSACNGAARGPRARHARRRGDHAPRAFTQAHDGGCSGGARVQAPRCELLRTALGRRRGKGT